MNGRIGKLKLKEQGRPKFIPRKAKKEMEVEDQEQVRVKDQITQYEPVSGTGLIVASGKAIHGQETNFKVEVQKGDYLRVVDPILNTVEEQIVTLVLGDKSILLQEPFFGEYSSFLPFWIRKKTKVVVGQSLTAAYKEKVSEATKTKGIKKAQIDVRLKKGHWSYEDKKVEVQNGLSREQLLDVREKLIKDKHCW